MKSTIMMRLTTLLSLFLLLLASADTTRAFQSVSFSRQRPTTFLQAASTPFAVIVKALVEPDRMAEFLTLMETNARETRKEPECLRFDVLRSQETPNEFFFYELYKSPDAIDHHKKQAHYKLWADFKESGGTISSETFKTDGEFLT